MLRVILLDVSQLAPSSARRRNASDGVLGGFTGVPGGKYA